MLDRVEGGGLAAAGGSGHQDHAVGHVQGAADERLLEEEVTRENDDDLTILNTAVMNGLYTPVTTYGPIDAVIGTLPDRFVASADFSPRLSRL